MIRLLVPTWFECDPFGSNRTHLYTKGTYCRQLCMQYIYSRVSTDKQEAQNQTANLLRTYPNATVIEEVASGAKHRPKLKSLLKSLEKGDILIVAALDRLGRRTSEILLVIEDLERRGVILKSVREGVDYSTPVGKLVTQIICSVAEMERSLISERTKEALRAKKMSGVVLGRKPTIPATTIKRIKELRAKGLTIREVQARTGVSSSYVARLTRT